ncbi:MAG: glycosyltransferase family 39 protein [Bdellovibrionales bacterium]
MLIPDKTFRIAAYGVFVVLALIAVRTFLDYGITWDEELQSQYGLAIADYYKSGFKDTGFDQLFNLYLYGGLFDALASIIDSYTPFFIYDTRHLLNAFFGLLGLWGTWKLGRFMGGDAVGFLALVLCALVPSYYGHMFNNPKDIPFAAGIVWTIYYMSRSYENPKLPTLIKLAIILGLTLGVRVGGVMVFAFWLAPMGLVALLPLVRNRNSKTWRAVASDIFSRSWRIVLPVALLAHAIMLVFWPWAQQNPLSNPLRALSEFSNFPQDVEVLLDGTIYRSTELPWTYVPSYFAIQLPEILILLLISFVLFLPQLWRPMAISRKQSLSLILLMIFVPVLYATIRHPALYDAVRHFLFVIPLACVIAAMAAYELFMLATSRCATRVALVIIFVASLAMQVFVIAKLHPYEYIYANQFIGGVRGAYGKYEADYWGSSFKEAATKLQAFVAAEGGIPAGQIYKVAICGPRSSATIYLPPNFRPVVANEPAEFFLSTTRWQCQNMRPGDEIIRVERLGAPLSIVKDLRNGYAYYEGNLKRLQMPPLTNP